MAYMNQERKAQIAAALKAVVPAGWKYSLAVRNHSTIVMTISAAPVDLLAEINAARMEIAEQRGEEAYQAKASADVNVHYVERQFSDSAAVMQQIVDALNTGNHDRSDLMTDYFDVGWYVDLSIGRWNKPFQFITETKVAA